ncbi:MULTISPECIES: hypothetical protein [unclassified Breznakia]|uniref:hypothetical protein n=1 Tax=unclassified Breznakia TaxID=2623764 RepID=UPI0024761E90|nr:MULTISPECIES: hypothetical protein [unclassified Breznakia]MDH6367562.1 hypothetical protein [Breznakia sp. PH1-1]MDH6404644.1 hypothetical protein [Breznakia sp. PF1-11]MDH6412392.1 hypothetical protein [Breznakia sp. PFB1-11]MDH6414730.1 hypothetical protein [Breznakia sp. PFB1-14]MDH6417025.1 hypothetical protein [Breznakia sp. PFB1-4]
MYQVSVSEAFKVAIAKSVRRMDCYFLFEGNRYNPISVKIDDNVYGTNNVFVGTFIAKSGTIKVDFKDQLNLENQSIEIFMGVYVNSTDIEYVPMGTYHVYEVSSDVEYKIMDSKMLFNIPFNTSAVTYPITIKNLLIEVCSQAGVPLHDDVLPNQDFVIPSEVFFGVNATCANVVEAIAQATCTVAHINRINELEMKWFNEVDINIGINAQSKQITTTEKYGPINSLVLSRMPQNENVYIQDQQSIDEHGLTEMNIANNPILDIDRNESKLEIFERVNGLEYIPFKCELQGQIHLDSCNVINITNRSGDVVKAHIFKHSIQYTGGIHSTLETIAQTKNQINYDMATSLESKVMNVELIVNKIDGEIRAEISNINTKVENLKPMVSAFEPENPVNGQTWIDISMSPPTEKTYHEGQWVVVGAYQGDLEDLQGQIESLNTSITMQQGSIELLVENSTTIINGNEVTLKEAYSYIQQQVDAINFAISESGGINKLLNSCGWNGMNFWELTGNISSMTDVDIRNNTVSGYAFMLNDGTLKQSFKTIVGRKYTVSCKIRKFTNTAYLKIMTGTQEVYLFNLPAEVQSDWVSFNVSFEALGNDAVVEVGSSGAWLLISDIMANDGEIQQQWSSSNDEIYTTNVKIDKNGIEVAQDGTNNKTVINTLEFAGYDASERVFSLNGDETEVHKLFARSNVRIGDMQIYARTTGNHGADFTIIKR